MPLLLSFPDPITTTAHLPVRQVYAIINRVSYDRTGKAIACQVGYYASEAACDAEAVGIESEALPNGFVQPATPEQANGLPIFDFLDAVLSARLQEAHPACTIVRVP